MILDSYTHLPNFPFDGYFESANQYISAQQYWINALRAAEGFHDSDWNTAISVPDIEDNMYTGLLVHIENKEDRKAIRINASSLSGYANFIFNEDLETASIMKSVKNTDDPFSKDIEKYSELAKIGGFPPPITNRKQAYDEAIRKFDETGGFEAGVDRRDFYIDEGTSSIEGSYVYGEVLTIISAISSINELKALHALKLFLEPGPAMARVNSVFSLDENQ